MTEQSTQQQAVELLQELGLKQYEAASFVALSRLPDGTAKQISEISDVPRTRIYDAIRALEAKGLVEVQRSNPQRFRAVPITEATETLRKEYEARSQDLAEALTKLDSSVVDDDREPTHDVWGLTGETSISNRTRQLIDEADSEIILIVGREDVYTPELVEHLHQARQRGVTVVIGTVTEELHDLVQADFPDTAVFVSGLEWLSSSPLDLEDTTTITRLLLIDQETILVSSISGANTERGETEKAVFGNGFDNGIVVITRRLLATGFGIGGGAERFPPDLKT
jgi:HTH-type transcriptional regulator, sugar sensing transcriptional regulator